MTGDEARRLIDEAIAALLLRGGGTPDGCRSVIERDNVDGPDRWQGWFRAATGLEVLVSTETVFTLDRRPGSGAVKGAVVQLPAVLREAVREPSDGWSPKGGYKRRTAHDAPRGEPVLVACPRCGVPRPVKNVSNNVSRAKLIQCLKCGRADRSKGLKRKAVGP